MRYLELVVVLLLLLIGVIFYIDKNIKNETYVYGKVLSKQNNEITIIDEITGNKITVKVNKKVYDTVNLSYASFL